MFVFVSELPARMCCNASIILIFCSFSQFDARLNRPDLNLNLAVLH
jgi:hypothetical protein